MKFSDFERIVSKSRGNSQSFTVSVSVASLSFVALIVMAVIELIGMPHRTISADAFLTVIIITAASLAIGYRLDARDRR